MVGSVAKGWAVASGPDGRGQVALTGGGKRP